MMLSVSQATYREVIRAANNALGRSGHGLNAYLEGLKKMAINFRHDTGLWPRLKPRTSRIQMRTMPVPNVTYITGKPDPNA
jgi:hypothetical protein